MSKKKKRKDTPKKGSNYQIELWGLLLILISIIGFGRFAIIGKLIGDFALFICGSWYFILLTIFFVVGIYMIIKRQVPNFLNSNLIGLYIIILCILVFSHLSYVNQLDDKIDIIKETINNFMASTDVISNIQGGGIIGGVFSSLFVTLLDVKGTKIVLWVMLIAGIIMFTGMSLYDIFMAIKKKVKLPKHHKVEQVQEEKDDKIVISSVDELIHVNDEKEEKEQPKEEIQEEVVENKGYKLPPMSLLSKPQKTSNKHDQKEIDNNITIIVQTLAEFGVVGKVVAVNIGPTVTQYELELKSGTKISKVLNINRELALALAAKDVRIEAPIPGKSTVGIELPNKKTSMVTVREILESIPKSLDSSKLLAVLGKDIMGKSMYMEINKTPHLLVAGSTGSGKSVCINSTLVSILMRARPDEVKIVLVDPKKVELSIYNGIPHLLAPVVTDPKKANIALKKIVVEMERRYDVFSDSKTKNIQGYNSYVEKQNEHLPESEKLKPLPYILVVIDELADLMLVAAKEVEESIMRITQMARAAGIHLIVATQRPSTDVITGVVKANIPSRISFAVSSSIDSRTILDMTGAEKLLGKGDMLFSPQGENCPIRIQGTFIDEEEIKAVVDYTIKQQKAHYDSTLLMDDEEMKATTMVEGQVESDEPLYNEIVEFVITQGKASTSLLQRRFHLGYNRAARAIDLLEERGIIGPSNGSKPREVLVKLEEKE